jgi:hypothetical protein
MSGLLADILPKEASAVGYGAKAWMDKYLSSELIVNNDGL